MRKVKASAIALALAASGCALPTWTPDTVPLLSQAGPVTTSSGVPVTCRDWACKCHCVKGCLQ